MRKSNLIGSLLILAVVVAGLAAPGSANSGQDELAEVRRATAHYHRVDEAIADGYQLGYKGIITGCIAHPTAGAMGYHYFHEDLFADPASDPLRPEGLVYAPGPNGQLKLVAVEWVVPSEVWAQTGSADPPSVLGHDLHVLNPALGWYILHAWVWMHNPSGMFEDWNPEVTCPTPVAPPTD